MKKLVLFAVLPLLIATGCTTQYQAKAPNDDVYFSSRDVPAVTTTKVIVKQSQVPSGSDYSYSNPQESNEQAENQQVDASQYSAYDDQPAAYSTESYSQPGSDTYITNNYYDDYYDYAYASRLRRFHSNYYFPSYYNDFYTNMYWYDYNPYSWGTSIYYNSGWFGPSFGMSFGWGWPSYSYGWGGYPTYYGSYSQGFYDGYYNGYYDGYYAGNYNNGWYNSEGGWYNDNNYYYGHRGQSGFAGGSSNGRTTAQAQGRAVNTNDDLLRNTNGRNIGSSTDNKSVTNARNDASKVSRDAASVNGRNTDAVPANGRIQQNSQSRMSQGNKSTTSPRANPGYKQNLQQGRGRYVAPSQDRQKATETGSNSQSRKVTPQTRYTNPQQQNNNRPNTNAQPKGNVYRENAPRQSAQPARTYTQPGTRIQSYSSPSYSKPKSSQEYTTPKYRDMRNSGNYSQPQQKSSGSNPNNSGNGAVRESTPRKSSNQSSSESQPSRSTYSAPTRSSDNSYSAPARSSSSSNDNSSRSSSGSNSGSSSGSSRSSSSSSGSGNGRR